MVWCSPTPIKPHTKFRGERCTCSKRRKAAATQPFFAGYARSLHPHNRREPGRSRPFTADDGTNVEMVMPGDRNQESAELICPVRSSPGQCASHSRGGRTIGGRCCLQDRGLERDLIGVGVAAKWSYPLRPAQKQPFTGAMLLETVPLP